MRNVILILAVFFATIVASCSKSNENADSPVPAFDLRVENLTDYDKHNARYLMTLWGYKTSPSVNKVTGYTRSENGSGKPFNIVENTVGRKPIYVYYQFYLHFEADNEQTALKVRNAIVDNRLKQVVYTAIKNVAYPNFKEDRDLRELNKIIVDLTITKLKELLKSDFDKNNIHISSYTLEPLKVVKQ